MFAQRLITETDMDGNLKKIPVLPPNCRLEVIFLDADNQTKLSSRNKRKPHSSISGKTKITGDIINTLSQNEWDLPK